MSVQMMKCSTFPEQLVEDCFRGKLFSSYSTRSDYLVNFKRLEKSVFNAVGVVKGFPQKTLQFFEDTLYYKVC